MKPLFTPTLLLSLLALAGCNNADDTTIDESASQQLIFSASLPDDEDTRMAFANETSPTLFWSAGDKIQVYSFEEDTDSSDPYSYIHSEVCSMTSEDNQVGTANAYFDGGDSRNWRIYHSGNAFDTSGYKLHFYAIHTNNMDNLSNSDISNGNVTFTIPDKQSGDLSSQVCYSTNDLSLWYVDYIYPDAYGDDSATEYNIANKKIFNKGFQFTPATALIRLRLKLPEEYQNKEITASICSENPNHEIAGTGTLALTSGTISATGNLDGITATGTSTVASDGYTDIYFATLPTSGETTISITVGIAGIDDREYAITAKTDTKDNTFTVDGLKSGTRYTVKRNVVVSKR
jgi:hypothetical protein